MFQVISDIMAHCYDIWNTIITAINFCNARKMNCALMFIMRNFNGIKYLCHLLQLEPCNDMFKVISDIMEHSYDMWISNVINFCNAKKMNIALMFIMSNHYGRKCLRNLLHFEPLNDLFKVISDIRAQCFDLWNTIIKAINFCNGKKMNCALFFIMSNHYG